MPPSEEPLKRSVPTRRRWLLSAVFLAAAVQIGTSPADLNARLAASPAGSLTTAPATTCPVIGLAFACPQASSGPAYGMTLSPVPGLVGTAQQFAVTVPAAMVTTSLPPSVPTVSGGHTVSFTGLSCWPGCPPIDWTLQTVVIQFDSPAGNSCAYLWSGTSAPSTTPCLSITNGQCPGTCNVYHQYTQNTTYHPALYLNYSVELPFVVGTMGNTVNKQQLNSASQWITTLNSPTSFTYDTISTNSNAFTQHYAVDNYSSYTYAGGGYNVSSEYVNGSYNIQSVCGQCGWQYDANCNEDCSQVLTGCDNSGNSWSWEYPGDGGYYHYITGKPQYNNKCVQYGDNDDAQYGWQVTTTSWNNTLNNNGTVNTYAESYVGTVNPQNTGTYDNQTLGTSPSSYTTVSVCSNCATAWHYTTSGYTYNYQYQSTVTVTLPSGQYSGSSGAGCPDVNNYSDGADWSGATLLPGCQATYYPGSLNVVTPNTTVGTAYTAAPTVTSASVTSQSPAGASATTYSISPATGYYTSRSTYYSGTYTGGFSSSWTNWRAYSCNSASHSGDGDGGDGDGSGVLNYYSGCNYHYDSYNANPWYYAAYGVSSSTNSYTYYNVNPSTVGYNSYSSSTVGYDSAVSNNPGTCYCGLNAPSVRSTPYASGPSDSTQPLTIDIIQAQGGL